MSFNNRMALKQVRKGIIEDINRSPEVIITFRRPFVDNGFGQLVPDPTASQVAQDPIKCRISHERKNIDLNGPGPAGFSTNLERYILTDYKTQIFEADTFEAIGREFKIGVVDVLKQFGGVVGYQALLIDANGGHSEYS